MRSPRSPPCLAFPSILRLATDRLTCASDDERSRPGSVERNVGVEPRQSPVDDSSEDESGSLYFIAKGTPLGEIETSPPSGGRAMTQYIAEFETYVKAAGITDEADVGNFGRFMENEPTTGAGTRSLGPSRIADALVAGWYDRSERDLRSMIESAYVAVQTGEAHSQCTAMMHAVHFHHVPR